LIYKRGKIELNNHNLEGNYNPKEFEDEVYKNWEKKEYFKPSMDKTHESYCSNDATTKCNRQTSYGTCIRWNIYKIY
jgi:hypothetical protein